MKTIASFSIKGGVGKTAAAVNLAFGAAQADLRTLLVDLDAQAAATFYFRVRPSRSLRVRQFFVQGKRVYRAIKASDYDNLDVLAAHRSFRNFDIVLNRIKKPQRRLRQLLKPLRKEYDLVILDCPPNASLLAEAVCHAADLVLVPVIPSTLSERTYEQLLKLFKAQDLPRKRLRPYFSMVQTRNKLHRETIEAMRSKYPRFLKSVIPLSAEIERMGIRREPVLRYAGQRSAANAYRALCQEMLGQLDRE
jgi:chromosome partitioning protein